MRSLRPSPTSRLESQDDCGSVVGNSDDWSSWARIASRYLALGDEEPTEAEDNIAPADELDDPSDQSVPRHSRLQADSFYQRSPAQSETRFSQESTNQQSNVQLKPWLPNPFDPLSSNLEEDIFEPVPDLPGLPRLDYKPLIIKEWTLFSICCFYIAVIIGLALLVHYDAKIFHIHETANKFTIRIVPPLIGTISTILFNSIVRNYVRILPYISMAEPVSSSQECPSVKKTILAAYFPRINVFHLMAQGHWLALSLQLANIVVIAPFITPFKSTLLAKKISNNDPNAWTVSVDRSSAHVLIGLFLGLTVSLIGLMLVLWNKRTGLKWDPVSFADQIMLWIRSDALREFTGKEYAEKPFWKRRDLELTGNLRLGYWRHRNTGRYWHGIREWPYKQSQAHKITNSPSRNDAQLNALMNEKSQQIRENPNICYRYTYMEISDYVHFLPWLISALLAGVGTWIIVTGKLKDGFEILSFGPFSATVYLQFAPAYLIQILNIYWTNVDIYYRLLQPFMGAITVEALTAKHWRLALLSTMPLVQKLLVILLSATFANEPRKNARGVFVTVDSPTFLGAFAIIVAYVFLIPYAHPGLDRRLPHIPTCIAEFVLFFYDSTLVRSSIFLPHTLHEERWHMVYRLRLAERRYAFGLYRGTNHSVHLGFDDVCAEHDGEALQIVTPVPSPTRWYRRQLKALGMTLSKILGLRSKPRPEQAEELKLLRPSGETPGIEGPDQTNEVASSEQLTEQDLALMSGGLAPEQGRNPEDAHGVIVGPDVPLETRFRSTAHRREPSHTR